MAASVTTLNDIHNQFVVTQIDKANGNIAFICQRFDAFVVMKEMSVDYNTPVQIKLPLQYIIKLSLTHCIFLRNKFIFLIDEENQKTPKIYFIPKLHKHPSKGRFIITAPQCSVKPLSKAIISVLKLMYKQIETCNSKMLPISEVKSFWLVQSNHLIMMQSQNLTIQLNLGKRNPG